MHKGDDSKDKPQETKHGIQHSGGMLWWLAGRSLALYHISQLITVCPYILWLWPFKCPRPYTPRTWQDTETETTGGGQKDKLTLEDQGGFYYPQMQICCAVSRNHTNIKQNAIMCNKYATKQYDHWEHGELFKRRMVGELQSCMLGYCFYNQMESTQTPLIRSVEELP